MNLSFTETDISCGKILLGQSTLILITFRMRRVSMQVFTSRFFILKSYLPNQKSYRLFSHINELVSFLPVT